MPQSKPESRWYEVVCKGRTPSGKALILCANKRGPAHYPTELIPSAVVQTGPTRYVRPSTLMMVRIPDNCGCIASISPHKTQWKDTPHELSSGQ